MSNTLWAVIVCIVLIVCTVLGRSFAKNSFAVIGLHNALWFLVILLLGTNLVAYDSASAGAWLTLLIGIMYFNIGAVFGNKTPDGQVSIEAVPALMSRRIFLLLISLYSVGFIVYLMTVAQRFGIWTLLVDPTSIRASEDSYLASVPLVFRMMLYIGPILFAVLGAKSSMATPFPLPVRLVGLAYLTVSMLALLQRTNLFMGVLLLVSLYISLPTQNEAREDGAKRNSRTRIYASVAVLSVILLASFQLLASALGKEGQSGIRSGAVSEPLAASGLTSVFTYATSGTAAFLALVDSDNSDWPPERSPGTLLIGDYNPQTWGAATFEALLQAVPIADPWNRVAPFVDVGVLTNVYTWMEHPYRDFRQIGLAIVMFGVGFLAGRLFCTRAQSSRRYWMQAAVMTTIFFSPFVPAINDTLFLIWIVVIWIVSGGNKSGSNRKPNEPPRRSRPSLSKL
jgi:oligosaccharide repeat unit polymerase